MRIYPLWRPLMEQPKEEEEDSQRQYIFKQLHSSNAPSTTCDTRVSSTNVNNTSYHHQATLALDIFTPYQKYTNRPTSGLYQVLYHLADPLCQAATANPQTFEHFIDYHLQPITTSIPSFIQDSLHFKSLLSDLDIRDSDILFSLDVESLYTNIPIQQGIASVKQGLSKHASTTKNRPDKFILTLLELTQ